MHILSHLAYVGSKRNQECNMENALLILFVCILFPPMFFCTFSHSAEKLFTDLLWIYTSKVAQTPVWKENGITCVLAAYWETIPSLKWWAQTLPWMGGLSLPPAACWTSLIWSSSWLLVSTWWNITFFSESPPCPSTMFPQHSCTGLHCFDNHWLQLEREMEVCLQVQTVKQNPDLIKTL